MWRWQRAQAYEKAAFSWGNKGGALPVNPLANLPVVAFVKRERVLTDELAAIWRATDGLGTFHGIVRFLPLTGLRRDEVAGMRWSELSGDVSTRVIPANRTKNGATHIVPLCAPAQDLLRSTPRFGELVFPGLRGPFNGWSKAKAALDAKSGMTNCRRQAWFITRFPAHPQVISREVMRDDLFPSSRGAFNH